MEILEHARIIAKSGSNSKEIEATWKLLGKAVEDEILILQIAEKAQNRFLLNPNLREPPPLLTILESLGLFWIR